jgi:hypothetical protein
MIKRRRPSFSINGIRLVNVRVDEPEYPPIHINNLDLNKGKYSRFLLYEGFRCLKLLTSEYAYAKEVYATNKSALCPINRIRCPICQIWLNVSDLPTNRCKICQTPLFNLFTTNIELEVESI